MVLKKVIKSRSISKKFYMSAINYYDSCVILKEQLFTRRNPSIVYPLIYLQRHTLELLLKSLILSDIINQDLSDGLVINIVGNKFDLSRTHSLDFLLDKYYSIHTQSRLIPTFDDKINVHKELIKKYDNYDRTSEFYRYPLTKSGKYTTLKLWTESDIVGDISKPNGMFVFNFENNQDNIKHVYNIDKKALLYQDKFIEMIDYFIKLSPFYKNRNMEG